MLKTGVVGATGYSGEVLVRILSAHPHVRLTTAMARSVTEPVPAFRRFPSLLGRVNFNLTPLDKEKLAQDCDLIFLALPHTQSMDWVVSLLKKGRQVIDLAGDFRLQNPDAYRAWYGKEHTAKTMLPDAVYGLTELNRELIGKARLIANPGCYATGVILAAAPLVKGAHSADGTFIADAKSGITGAGREPAPHFHFPEMHGNAWPYRVNQHAHQPEMVQALRALGGGDIRILFTPQVIPVSRGILTTVYVRLAKRMKQEELLGLYRAFYRSDSFVRVREAGYWPRIRDVEGTNFCDVSVAVADAGAESPGAACGTEGDYAIIVSALDNLVKGAGGQAVQNMNVMHGWKETEGLL